MRLPIVAALAWSLLLGMQSPVGACPRCHGEENAEAVLSGVFIRFEPDRRELVCRSEGIVHGLRLADGVLPELDQHPRSWESLRAGDRIRMVIHGEEDSMRVVRVVLLPGRQ